MSKIKYLFVGDASYMLCSFFPNEEESDQLNTFWISWAHWFVYLYYMWTVVFWVVLFCSLVGGYQHFSETYHLHLQGINLAVVARFITEHQRSGQRVWTHGPDHQRSNRDQTPCQHHEQGRWFFIEQVTEDSLFTSWRNRSMLSPRKKHTLLPLGLPLPVVPYKLHPLGPSLFRAIQSPFFLISPFHWPPCSSTLLSFTPLSSTQPFSVHCPGRFFLGSAHFRACRSHTFLLSPFPLAASFLHPSSYFLIPIFCPPIIYNWTIFPFWFTSVLKMEMICSCKTSVTTYKTIQHHTRPWFTFSPLGKPQISLV